MDIQKIITDVVAKLTSNPDLIKGFLRDLQHDLVDVAKACNSHRQGV